MIINYHWIIINIILCFSRPDSNTANVKLVFDCSFPVPSESMVLNAIQTLLISRSANISDTVKVLGFYYNSMFSLLMTPCIYKHLIICPFHTKPITVSAILKKKKKRKWCLICSTETSANSYEVNFIINISIIMPEKHALRKNTYKQIQTSISNTVSKYDHLCKSLIYWI